MGVIERAGETGGWEAEGGGGRRGGRGKFVYKSENAQLIRSCPVV